MKTAINLAFRLDSGCVDCASQAGCLAGGGQASDLAQVEQIVEQRRTVRRGERLVSIGDPFASLFTIRSGFLKSSILNQAGGELITGFLMSGELVGFDGLCSGMCASNVTALEDTVVCEMPYLQIVAIARGVPSLRRQLNRVFGREILRDQGIMMLLGTMDSQERLAAFLLNLSRRLQQRGFSGTELLLRMTRGEIGNYLGMKLETVSRLFSQLHQCGVLSVEGKQVRILDVAALKAILSSDR